MQKITPFLWFDTNAEEAANFYVSTFKRSKITSVSRYGEGMPAPAGSVMTVSFELDGQDFTALNGGPTYKFTPAISLVVNCENQAELDDLWAHLTEGGREIQCGWLRDKYGLSWQIVPSILPKLVTKDNPAKASAVMRALMKMVKLDIAELQKAYDQG